MDDHDQLKFFFFFILFFVWRRFQARERRRSARKCYGTKNGTQETGTRIVAARLRLSCRT